MGRVTIEVYKEIFNYEPINSKLARIKILPIVDIQIRRINGKFRSLPLIAFLLETNNLGCFRQRKTYSYFPNIEIFTPRDNIINQERVISKNLFELIGVWPNGINRYPETPPETINDIACELSISSGWTESFLKSRTLPAKLYDWGKYTAT